MDEPAISLESVSKTFPRAWRMPPQHAVRGISLQVEEGEAFGFVGANGAGKSTTIKMLLDVLRPTAGKVRIFGKDTADSSSRSRVGYVPENPSLPDYLTPLEILRTGLRLHGIQAADEVAYGMKWIDRLGLSDAANKYVRGFSKGMVQRTALAHALAVTPRLLILDEPLSGLDPLGRKQVVDILEEYRLGGGTLFFSSHVLYDVERLADRFGLIHRGELLTIRSPQEIVAEQEDGFIVLFQSVSPLLGARALRGDRYELFARQEELPVRLSEIATAGAKLIEVRPKVSLESVFLRMVGMEYSPPLHSD